MSNKSSQNKHSILLVDDNRLFVAAMSKELEVAGYKVNIATTVDKAEFWLENNPRPDLVVLDLQMPGRNGFELVDRLNELNNIPFIMLSAYSEAETIERANRLGTMVYLVKPIDSVQLIPAIETVLGRSSELQSLQSSKQQMQSALDDNRELNIAIGITMMRFNRARNQAFELLRTASRQQNRKLSEIANDVINECETAIRERANENT